MRLSGNTWAVVLAAGDGTRLATWTTDSTGNAVPKQFCSLSGSGSLLEDAVLRAGRVVSAERICVIVSDQHRCYWPRARWSVHRQNIIVQPANRGTAHGILLAVLSVIARDPFARIVFLPADHHVQDEGALADAVRATASLACASQALALVGIEPDEPDPELGYIVPGRMLRGAAYLVERFVEKPPLALASQLLAEGALWNSFIFAADAGSLLSLFRQRTPHGVDAMATALARQDATRALAELYRELHVVDFSRTIIQGCEQSLSVVAAPSCGWSDLGTPKRVAETLRRMDLRGVGGSMQTGSVARAPALINLAAQHAQQKLTNWGTTS